MQWISIILDFICTSTELDQFNHFQFPLSDTDRFSSGYYGFRFAVTLKLFSNCNIFVSLDKNVAIFLEASVSIYTVAQASRSPPTFYIKYCRSEFNSLEVSFCVEVGWTVVTIHRLKSEGSVSQSRVITKNTYLQIKKKHQPTIFLAVSTNCPLGLDACLSLCVMNWYPWRTPPLRIDCSLQIPHTPVVRVMLEIFKSTLLKINCFFCFVFRLQKPIWVGSEQAFYIPIILNLTLLRLSLMNFIKNKQKICVFD